ncbi:MAG TPA: MarR family transcriptional regulator [Mycobacterium sp.]|nr:MarR family transcriptional regulator [Mycobacterium sp.]
MKTKAAAVAEISDLLRAVGDLFDTTDGDAERDFMAAHCPSRLRSVVREMPTLSMHLLDHLTDEPTNVVALAVRAGQLKGTASKHIQRLVDAGLVKRSPVPGNRKEVALSLTEDGRTVVRVHRQMHDEMNRGLEDFLSRYSCAELATVIKILQDLLKTRRVGVRLMASEGA